MLDHIRANLVGYFACCLALIATAVTVVDRNAADQSGGHSMIERRHPGHVADGGKRIRSVGSRPDLAARAKHLGSSRTGGR